MDLDLEKVLKIMEAKRDCWMEKLKGCTCNDSCPLAYEQGKCGEQPIIYQLAIDAIKKELKQ